MQSGVCVHYMSGGQLANTRYESQNKNNNICVKAPVKKQTSY